ncbi:MAG: thymidylate synthase [Candidatus Lokiarchaeota archaeon]|nr:thymidylate synthase [Candidatus Lokiarchaeota archaeon]
MRIYVLHSYGEYVNRFVETLATHSPSLAASIIGIEELSKDLPSFVEDVSPYLPDNMLESDLLIVLGVHPDILASLSQIIEKTGATAVIVPLEDPIWCPLGLQKQIESDLEEIKVEYSFPKPFCSLQPDKATPIINEFIELAKMGMPIVEINIDNELFSEDCRVLRSAPCGSTYYVIDNLKAKHISDVEQDVPKYHHSYPCTASMAMDNVLGDTIMHRAIYMILAAVKNAMRQCETS